MISLLAGDRTGRLNGRYDGAFLRYCTKYRRYVEDHLDQAGENIFELSYFSLDTLLLLLEIREPAQLRCVSPLTLAKVCNHMGKTPRECEGTGVDRQDEEVNDEGDSGKIFLQYTGLFRQHKS